MSQTYFERYEFVVNVVCILIATSTYNPTLLYVRMNQSNETTIYYQSLMTTFSKDFNLAFHSTHIVCVNLIMSSETYSLELTLSNKFLSDFSWQY